MRRSAGHDSRSSGCRDIGSKGTQPPTDTVTPGRSCRPGVLVRRDLPACPAGSDHAGRVYQPATQPLRPAHGDQTAYQVRPYESVAFFVAQSFVFSGRTL